MEKINNNNVQSSKSNDNVFSVNDAVDNDLGALNSSEIAEYATTMLASLWRLTVKANMSELTYYLEMAHQVAFDEVDKEVSSRRPTKIGSQ